MVRTHQLLLRDTWEALFRSQGMKHPLPRILMIDGFNEGWIDFEGKRTFPSAGGMFESARSGHSRKIWMRPSNRRWFGIKFAL